MALIKGKQLVAGTIDTRELKDLSVTNAKINTGEITPDRLNISGQVFDFSGAASLSVPTPSADGHAASKSYVDGVAQGLDVKESVITTGDPLALPNQRFTYSAGVYEENDAQPFRWSATLELDGVSLALGDRVLVKDASDPAANGIFYVSQVGDGSAVKWKLERATDADTTEELTNGAFVFVGSGTNQGAGYVLTSLDPITINTSALTFTQFSGAGQLTGGDGVTISGNTISLDLAAAGGLEIASAQLSLKVEDASLVLSANGLKVQHNGTSTATDTNGIKAAVPSSDKLNLTPNVAALDQSSTGISLTSAPADGSRVDVFVNGVAAAVGSGTKALDCYFSADNGVTPKTFADLAAGDVLYWNGSSVYPLDGTDRVSLFYVGAL